ncbi:hypothetical protein BJ912DRAFT_824272, partial [Pholiota molesta]
VAQNNPPLDPPQNQPNINPLDECAVSAEEKARLDTVRRKLMEIEMETCSKCHERWFDLNVKRDSVCANCKKNNKFQETNAMDPLPMPLENLPALTQMEEMLIAPVHALIQLWQVRG